MSKYSSILHSVASRISKSLPEHRYNIQGRTAELSYSITAYTAFDANDTARRYVEAQRSTIITRKWPISCSSEKDAFAKFNLDVQKDEKWNQSRTTHSIRHQRIIDLPFKLQYRSVQPSFYKGSLLPKTYSASPYYLSLFISQCKQSTELRTLGMWIVLDINVKN